MSDDVKSEIVIKFNTPGAADFVPEINNVTPAQMFAAAAWLRWRAEKAFDSDLINQAQRQARNKIEVPIGALNLKKGPHA